MGISDLFQLAGLAAFLALVMGRAIAVRRHTRRNPIRIGLHASGTRTSGSGALTPLGLVVGMNAWIVEVLRSAGVGFPQILPAGLYVPRLHGVAWQVLGMLVVLAGFGLLALASRALGDSWRLGIDDQRPGQLVTDGIYALTRNPIYLFFDFYLLGTLLINGTLVLLLYAIMGVVTFHLQVRQEERFLAATFGDAYRVYAARVPRYLPFGTWIARRAYAPLRTRRRGCAIAPEGYGED